MENKEVRYSFNLYVYKYETPAEGYESKVAEYQLNSKTFGELNRQLVELEAVMNIQNEK